MHPAGALDHTGTSAYSAWIAVLLLTGRKHEATHPEALTGHGVIRHLEIDEAPLDGVVATSFLTS